MCYKPSILFFCFNWHDYGTIAKILIDQNYNKKLILIMGPTRARHESKKLLMCCDAFIHLCLFGQSLYDSKKSVGWDVVQTRNAWALNGARQAKNVFKRNLSIKGADL